MSYSKAYNIYDMQQTERLNRIIVETTLETA